MMKRLTIQILVSIIVLILFLALCCSKDPVTPVNSAPTTPVIDGPSNTPSNGSTDQPLIVTLRWICSDPDGDPITYDVHLGTNSNPSLISSSQSNDTYTTDSLVCNTKYYWRIVAKDGQGHTTGSPIWEFTTEDCAPITSMLYGVVKSSSNIPLMGIKVTILDDEDSLSSNQDYTDANGNYQIQSVRPGERIIRIEDVDSRYSGLVSEYNLTVSEYDRQFDMIMIIGHAYDILSSSEWTGPITWEGSYWLIRANDGETNCASLTSSFDVPNNIAKAAIELTHVRASMAWRRIYFIGPTTTGCPPNNWMIAWQWGTVQNGGGSEFRVDTLSSSSAVDKMKGQEGTIRLELESIGSSTNWPVKRIRILYWN